MPARWSRRDALEQRLERVREARGRSFDGRARRANQTRWVLRALPARGDTGCGRQAMIE